MKCWVWVALGCFTLTSCAEEPMQLEEIQSAATTPLTTTLGAIRWDGWTPGEGAGGGPGYNGIWDQWAHHWMYDKLPFYSYPNPSGTPPEYLAYNVGVGVPNQQAKIDAELLYAKNAGISYFAYLKYEDNSSLAKARELHDQSIYKNDVKIAWINWDKDSASGLIASCDAFTKPNYMKVLNNRPLVYSKDCTPADIGPGGVSSLRYWCSFRGINPYVVILSSSQAGAESCAATQDYDAISVYAQDSPSQNQPYADYAASIVSNWNSFAATGRKIIPWVSAGWDPRPRIFGMPVNYVYPYYTNPINGTQYFTPASGYVQRPEPWQISSEVFSAFHYNKNWPNVAEANTALVYAWNEFTEGGWLCPTTFGGVINTSRVDKLRLLTRNYLDNVAQNGSSGASSFWPSYPAANAFDGNNSVWQCNTANNCALWVFFPGGTKLINKIAISEAYARVTGFTVYYRSGTNWLPLITGTTIGEQKYLTTASVNTNAIMLSMQSSQNPIIRELQAFGIP
jgi:hypothetical protein